MDPSPGFDGLTPFQPLLPVLMSLTSEATAAPIAAAPAVEAQQ